MSIKLTYFNLRGGGEVIRYLLMYGGIDFEDIRVTSEDWPEIKPTTPFGQLPLYEEHGKLANQAVAIARYLAKKVKLSGNSDWEDLELDALVDTTCDLLQKVSNVHHEKDQQEKERLRKLLLSETVPFYLDRFETRAKNNFGFLAFGRLTWADFFFTTAIEAMDVITETNLLENFPNLQDVVSSVTDLRVIKEWRQKRPVTVM